MVDFLDDDSQNLIIYNTEDGQSKVSLYARDGNIFMSQAQLAELFDTSVQNISNHILNILNEKELLEDSVIKDYLITATDGKSYSVRFYALDMILAIGFRVRSIRGTQFRKWANTHLKQYLVKGFVVDAERLKNPDGRTDYFDELLEKIRDIRASEKRFYQKVRDLLALSTDYDSTDKATQMFFAETQNKLLYAITKMTAAELILSRADADKLNMGLTSWKGSIVRKGDITIAKNYLTHDEVDSLNRLTVIFLESAELRVKSRKDLTLGFWQNNIDQLLTFNDFPILPNTGGRSHAQMEKQAKLIYETFDQKRKLHDAKQADAEDLAELVRLEQQVKQSKENKK
uniref:virulence RhuM family protein n=1 Tax=uncultured Acinetobacter sp. TaxID=165433 RepID=UPI00260AD6F6|nr:virulence RhuM family protein [uncultured Acinetobacter sp.]